MGERDAAMLDIKFWFASVYRVVFLLLLALILFEQWWLLTQIIPWQVILDLPVQLAAALPG
jgi:hypothetical protein